MASFAAKSGNNITVGEEMMKVVWTDYHIAIANEWINV